MKKNTLEIRSILEVGGGVEVDAKDYTPIDLRGMAMATRNGGGKLFVRNAAVMSGLTCRGIAMCGERGGVIFDFTR